MLLQNIWLLVILSILGWRYLRISGAGVGRIFWPSSEAGHKSLMWEMSFHCWRKGASLSLKLEGCWEESECFPQFTTLGSFPLSCHIFPCLGHGRWERHPVFTSYPAHVLIPYLFIWSFWCSRHYYYYYVDRRYVYASKFLLMSSGGDQKTGRW